MRYRKDLWMMAFCVVLGVLLAGALMWMATQLKGCSASGALSFDPVVAEMVDRGLV
jgi:hypothetical protein